MAASMSSEDFGLEGGDSRLSALGTADDYGNDTSVETFWAIKAFDHSQVYFNILCAVDPRVLRLTPEDDRIYDEFTKLFSDLNVGVLNVDDLKSKSAKEKWRPFCNKFEGVVEDFNFGTLLRIDSTLEYTEVNSILVTRIQFYAIEIARNRNGFNDKVRETFKRENT